MLELKAGQVLAGRFTLERSLGDNVASPDPQRAQVWLALDAAPTPEQVDARVALKIIPLSQTRTAAFVEHEFLSARRVQHAAILPTYGLFEHEHLRLMASMFAERGSIGRLVGSAPDQFLPLLLPVVEALGAIHDRGLVHRDVKPGNVLLGQDRAYLADFGVASALDPQAPGHIRSGGSPFNMSPQQYRQQPPSPADDVYALGATLYELITGRPPFYPDFDAQRLLEQPPTAIVADAQCPADLTELVMQMLAKAPAQRPANMQAVHQALSSIASRLSNTTIAPAVAGLNDGAGAGAQEQPFDVVEAVSPRLWQVHESAPTAATDRQQSARVGVRNATGVSPMLIGGGLAALAGLAAFMFIFVPRLVTPPQITPVEARAPVDEAPSDVIGPYEFARLARDRDEVRTLVEGLLVLQTTLEERRADIWAPERYAKLLELAEAGDTHFKVQEFEASLATYNEAMTLAEALIPLAQTAFEVRLSEAWKTYETGNAERAIEAFTLALEIDPDSAQAQTGLQRSQNLEQVLALVVQARALEQAGKLSEASDVYRQASKLDPAREEPPQALARINQTINARQFDNIMSQGFAAIQGGNYEQARGLFRRARALNPDSQAPVDAILQLDSEIGLRNVRASQSQASTLEVAEQWDKAIMAYQEILQEDASMEFAQQGLARAQQMLAVNEEVDQLLADPLLVSGDGGYQRAGEILAFAQTASGGPQFSGKIAQLRNIRASALIPVSITLRSDNLTEVTLFREGPLGRFEQHELELRPGVYTVVGTRTGYRDVRRKFTVLGGQVLSPIEIRCEESI